MHSPDMSALFFWGFPHSIPLLFLRCCVSGGVFSLHLRWRLLSCPRPCFSSRTALFPARKKLLSGLRLGKGTVRNEESKCLLSQIYFLRHARRRCWNAPNPSHFVVKNDFSSERPCQNANATRRGSTLTYYHPLSPERSLSAA